jgi:hypothetical protein
MVRITVIFLNYLAYYMYSLGRKNARYKYSVFFVTERAGTPFQISFSEGLKPEQRSGTFSPGIDITNISRSPTKFWVTMRSATYFL